MRYSDKNIFECDTEETVVVCIPSKIKSINGLAKQIIDSYEVNSRLKRHKLKVGKSIALESKRTILFMVTKKINTSKPSYDILNSCLHDLKQLCNKHNITKLAFPKYGASMDKLDWNIISDSLNKILTNIQLTIYLNNEKAPSEEKIDELDINTKIKKLQKQDLVIQNLIEKVDKKKLRGFIMENGILMKLRKARNKRIFKQLIIPETIKPDVFKLCHDNFTGAHLGEKKTWIRLNNRFYCPNSSKDTISYVKSCAICACTKEPTPSRADLKPILDFSKPFDKVGVDVLELSSTDSGNKYAVVFIDYLTKWVEAFPLKNMTAESIAKVFINEIVTRHSAPKELLSDQGANFMSKLIKEVCRYFEINKINTSPYNPKCDGLTERFNKTLCKMLAVYSNANQTNWDLYLPLVLFAYRTSQQTTTGSSPFELLYGRDANLPSDLDSFDKYESSKFMDDINYGWIEAKRQIIKQAEKNKNYYDSKYKNEPVRYSVNDQVRVKQMKTKRGLRKKLRNDLWSEPQIITKVLSEQNVELNGKKVVNVNNIKKKEGDRAEVIRSSNTTTRFGRISKAKYYQTE